MDLARPHAARRPFRSHPDLDLFVARPATDAALSGLTGAVEGRDGFAMLDGPAGTGKTLVALKFLDELDSDLTRVFIPAARFAGPRELFQTLLFDDHQPFVGRSEHEMRLAVTGRLLGAAHQGPAVLVLDEAQHLSDAVLEELRLLGNLATRHGSALVTVLVADDSLSVRLRDRHPSLHQRLAARHTLAAMTEGESEDYLCGQLALAGDDADRLTADAKRLLARGCLGVPRTLNRAAGLALALAADEPAADVEAATEALESLGLAVADLDAELPSLGPDRESGRRSA